VAIYIIDYHEKISNVLSTSCQYFAKTNQPIKSK